MKKIIFHVRAVILVPGAGNNSHGSLHGIILQIRNFLPTPEAKLFFDQIGDRFQNNALHDPKGVTGHLGDQSDRTCYANITIPSARYYCDIIVILLQY